jgi:aspartokinase
LIAARAEEGDLLVVKFGGASLANGTSIARAADVLLASSARRKLVVVSAPGTTTDMLLSLVRGVPETLDGWEVARLLSLGERASARLFTSLLRSRGIRALSVEPDDDSWPVVTLGGPLRARLDFDATRTRVEERLAPLLEEQVVVVCGFLGSEDGRVTNLDRGGSDTTAVVLGRILGAPEVHLVKDVAGILEADPRSVPTARPLASLSASDLSTLADGGARVVSPEAAHWLGPGQRLRVLPLGEPLDRSGGTSIEGAARPPLAEVPAVGSASERVASVSAVLDDLESGLSALHDAIPPDRWYGLSAVPGALTVFVGEEHLPEVLGRMHASGAFRALASRRGLSRLSIPLHAGPTTPPTGLASARDLVGAARGSGRLELFVCPEDRAFSDARPPESAASPEGP